MAPRTRSQKTLTNEEKKKKRAEYDKKRREKMKKDPDLWAQQQKKETEKWKKKIEKKQRKLVSDMTDREKRQQRKKWREDWKKKMQKQEMTHPKGLSTSSENTTPHRELQCLRNSLKKQKQLRKDDTEKIRILEEKTRKQQTTIERLKKRETRAKKVTKSPASKTKQLIQHGTPKQVMRRLLFAETMTHSLEEGYKTLLTNDDKNKFSRLVMKNAWYFKKYKLMTDLNFISSKIFHMNYEHRINNFRFRMKLKKLKAQVEADVIKFYEDDEHSRPCPGKNDFLVRKKVKHQKRFLSATLKRLHEKFYDSMGYLISYSTFCKLKPFWVVHQKITEGDTCGCKTHENMNLLVKALHLANETILAKSVEELLNDLCCDSSATSCLLRKCPSCLNNVITYGVFDSNEPITYPQWNLIKENITLRNKQRKTVTHVTKEIVQSTKGLAVDFLESQAVKFMKHEAIMIHQTRQFKLLKLNMTEKDFLIHCDYSENYAAKLNTEIQSFHFGGSRKQFTLHTVQVYYKNNAYSTLKSQSICTLSEVNDHSPNAVFAHLKPIFDFLAKNAPNVENIHFQSDCPSNQYRNKTIFHLIPHVFGDMSQIKSVTWNYSAPGHGKGAPDGVGGCLKRTADRVVAEGVDVNDFTTFVEKLQSNTRNIMLHIIKQEDIDEVMKQIPGFLPAFKGTMQVHQVVFEKANPDLLKMKSLSCFTCLNCDDNLIGEFKTLQLISHSRNNKKPAEFDLCSQQCENLSKPEANFPFEAKYAIAVDSSGSSSNSNTTKICYITGISKVSEDNVLVYWLEPVNESQRFFSIDVGSGVKELPKKDVLEILPSPTMKVVGKKVIRTFPHDIIM